MSYDITRLGTRLVLLPSVTSYSGRAGFYRTEQANAGCLLRSCQTCVLVAVRGPDTVSSAPSGELLVNYCILSHLSFIMNESWYIFLPAVQLLEVSAKRQHQNF